ncbi:MAG: hypothetical protein Q4C79_06780 [Neisseria sp.]|uniref:hypothetical protein n=1 Tax=Neisseria sp. TaxID=192066 RepID=UPI0026DAA315|nr:hypothetical protein [Neisseria sp.]MDO4248649.1 hypothetical protein [Neisseria sp.]
MFVAVDAQAALQTALHDLFIGEVAGAWADDRIFENGHWKFDEAPDDLKTLHYVAGGQFYRIGKGLTVEKGFDTP